MTYDQIFLLVLLAALFALFVRGPLRYDVAAFAALLAAVIFGPVPASQAFSGFGHPATITVAAVLIISRALINAGAVDLIAARLIPPRKSTVAQIGGMAGVAAAMSAVMNNVGALALLMPAALQSARKAKRPASLVLMPLSFASILGGLVTLIGTPPNIIVAAFRTDVAGAPFGMFDFTPVGGAVALAGLAFVALVGWRLLPQRAGAASDASDLFQIESYVSEARVPRGSAAIGRTLGELDDSLLEHDALILALMRRDRRRIGRNEEVRSGDILLIEAAPERIDAALREIDVRAATRRDEKASPLQRARVTVAEAVVPPPSSVVGQTVESLRLKRRFGVDVLAVSRHGTASRGRLRSFRLRSGDALLLEGGSDGVSEAIRTLRLLPLAARDLQVGRPQRAGLTIGVFAAAVAAATAGLITVPIALALAAAVLVALAIVPPREIYESIDWPVIVLLGALIPIGQAMQATGTTQLIAGAVAASSAGLPPAALLALVLVVTMTLSDILNNAATAVVMAPIGGEVAARLGVSADPFLMAVAVGASCAFLTPIGHQNNMLILGPGGYAFGDYWRMGLPLEVLIVLVAVPMILIVWPL